MIFSAMSRALIGGILAAVLASGAAHAELGAAATILAGRSRRAQRIISVSYGQELSTYLANAFRAVVEREVEQHRTEVELAAAGVTLVVLRARLGGRALQADLAQVHVEVLEHVDAGDDGEDHADPDVEADEDEAAPAEEPPRQVQDQNTTQRETDRASN